MDTIPQFHNAAWDGPIANGSHYISNVLLPKSDVLILSDVNHANAQTLFSDVLSPECLKDYAAKGVTDIYLEILEKQQPLINQLATEEIDGPTFIKEMEKISFSKHLTETENRTNIENLIDAVIAGTKTTPPIRFHAAQMSNTPEQAEAIDIVNTQIDNVFNTALEYADDFFKKLEKLESGHGVNIDNSDDIDLIYKKITPIFIDRTVTDEKIYFNPHKILNDHFDNKILEEHFDNKLPGMDMLLVLTAQNFYDLNQKQISLVFERNDLNGKFRIDNDTLLAQKIIGTKDPNGRAIVIHGVSHSTERHTDLDDQLQEKGYAINRVNVVYDTKDLTSTPEINIDPSDINYFPRDNEIKFIDFNDDGVVNGSYHDINTTEESPYNMVDQTPVIPHAR